MIEWSASFVGRVLDAVEVAIPATFTSVSTDTRSLREGALFVALVGERFDGHDYLKVARSKGALGAVVRTGTPPTNNLIQFEVADTTETLGKLARARRREIGGPVVAVTGTNGKTSTKEMLACALCTRWHVHATRENLNNLVGVPLTILEAPPDCDALVVEVGANQVGEIARLRDVVEPSVSVVTNVGHGHLEGFGSFEGVLSEKCALLEGAPLAVVGNEPPALAARARQVSDDVIVAGLEHPATFVPDTWELDEQVTGRVRVDGVDIRLPIVGYHQLENLMLVMAVANHLGLDRQMVAESLRNVRLPPGRCEVLAAGERTILQDAYNSNPGSLRALLRTANALRRERRLVVIVGTMLELGRESASLHEKMAADVMNAKPYIVAAMGEFVPAFERFAAQLGDRLLTAEDAESLGRQVAGHLSDDDLVLVKGSRGVHLEDAIPFLFPIEETPCSTTS